MRTLLFFDLPSVTLEEKRYYRKFVKFIKSIGFIMLQESVYYMLSINQQNAEMKLFSIRSMLPPNGNVMTLMVTEKQFSNIKILLGDYKSNVISDNERTVIF